MPIIVHFGEFLKNWSLRSNSVTRHVTFKRTKIGGKCQNQKLKMRHFESFSNIVRLRDFHFWSFRSFLATFPWICILWLWIINWLKIAHVGNNKGDLFMKLTEKILKEFWIICWSQWKWKNLPKNAIFRIFPLIYSWDIENKNEIRFSCILEENWFLPNFT